jgi:hypothetical protein
MNIDLTQEETIIILDAIGNRIDDLNDCAMFGDADEIEGEIENLQELINKLGDALETGSAPNHDRSETQGVDVWNPNDPKNW